MVDAAAGGSIFHHRIRASARRPVLTEAVAPGERIAVREALCQEGTGGNLGEIDQSGRPSAGSGGGSGVWPRRRWRDAGYRDAGQARRRTAQRAAGGRSRASASIHRALIFTRCLRRLLLAKVVVEFSAAMVVVQFSVDLAQESMAPSDVIYLQSTFNGWCGSCAPMARLSPSSATMRF